MSASLFAAQFLVANDVNQQTQAGLASQINPDSLRSMVAERKLRDTNLVMRNAHRSLLAITGGTVEDALAKLSVALRLAADDDAAELTQEMITSAMADLQPLTTQASIDRLFNPPVPTAPPANAWSDEISSENLV